MSYSDDDYDVSHQLDLLQELCDFCESNDLSVSRLQEKISLFPSYVIAGNGYKYKPFFHKICLNENITMEIVEYIMNEFPGMI